MFESHPAFTAPSDPNKPIWRYQELAKFIHLLHTSSLHFARADQLGDPFEGTVSKKTLEKRNLLSAFFKNQGTPNADQLPQVLSDQIVKARKETYVNCWHLNDSESAAMWALYAKDLSAIAVQSTFQALTDSFTLDTPVVHIGTVDYVDYDNTVIPENNHFFPFLHKRLSFQHERELRAIVWLNANRELWQGPDVNLNPTGLNVKIDLDVLIHKVYVSPSAPDWFAEIVRALVRQSNLAQEVVHSKLGESPVY